MKRLYSLRRRLSPILLSLVILSLAVSPVLAAAGTLEIVSAWGGADQTAGPPETPQVTVTYVIKSGKGVPAEATTAVEAGIAEWNSSIDIRESGWDFDLVPFVSTGKGSKADIEISIKKGGGLIAGMALRSYDTNGFIVYVKIQISGSAFGLANDPATVTEVTLHELGHALGLGHHSNEADLLGRTVGYEGGGPSACDLDGFVAAHHWLTVDGGSSPHLPHVSSITCS